MCKEYRRTSPVFALFCIITGHNLTVVPTPKPENRSWRKMQAKESHGPDISAPICSSKVQSKIGEEQREKEEL